MKWSVLLLSTLSGMTALGQAKFVRPDYSRFYDWFHQQSQVAELYTDRSTLYIYNASTKVMAQPSWRSTLLAQLELGATVQNIAYPQELVPMGTRLGYTDMWFHIKGKKADGQAFTGYIWGGDIAKGWRFADLNGDGQNELLLLGLPSKPRQSLTDIRAELRVTQQGKILTYREISGLCLFEDCATSPLLRVFNDPAHPGLTLIEASTMTIGCDVGIDRAFFYWDGKGLACAYYGEFTTNKVYRQAPLVVKDPISGEVLQSCRFSHIDVNFNPVWECQDLQKPVVAPLPVASLRAR